MSINPDDLELLKQQIVSTFHSETGAIILAAAQMRTGMLLDRIKSDLDLDFNAQSADGRTFNVRVVKKNGKVEKALITFSLI